MADNQWFDIDYQWVDNPNYEWVFGVSPTATGTGLYHVWMDDDYAYAATVSGLYITDLETELPIAFVKDPASNPCMTVVSDDDYVYLGTSAGGVKRLNKAAIAAGGNVYTSLTGYVEEPWLTSNNTIYMHGNDNNLILCTDEGVDIIRKNSMFVSSTTVSGAKKCFVTPNNYYYYTVLNASGDWTLNRLDGNTNDWTTPDAVYTTGTSFLIPASEIKDFYVTEHTSLAGDYNTLFIVTDVNVTVYDEGSGHAIRFTVST